mmetsp:Transcript_64739/g.187657  ORF Transcript_64739/g.187657 Transcript_64739/m.187657 type:complete len:103 (-) Transcript_64739:56-364(-)
MLRASLQRLAKRDARSRFCTQKKIHIHLQNTPQRRPQPPLWTEAEAESSVPAADAEAPPPPSAPPPQGSSPPPPTSPDQEAGGEQGSFVEFSIGVCIGWSDE